MNSAQDIQIFTNQELGFKIRTQLNKDGSISMSAEDTAIGFGWTKVETKEDKEYTTVRWARMADFSKELGFDHKWAKEDYVPESLFYLLGMKANNEVARRFQMWLATEVIPSIRKHGAFIADGDNIDEKFIANELRFSQKRTIKSFANCPVEDIQKLYKEFKEYVDTEYKYQTDTRVARYKSVEKGLQQLHDNLAVASPENVGDCYNVRKLKEQVIVDRTTLEKRISGGEKAYKTKRIADLEEMVGGLSEVDDTPSLVTNYRGLRPLT